MYHQRSRVFVILFALLLTIGMATVKAQQAYPSFAPFFDSVFQEHELSGNVLVASHDTVLYQHGYGFADEQQQLPNSPAAAFHLASLSKVFTSVAILQLKEKGKLRLDDAAALYLPTLPFKNITIRHLLTHTSGLADFQIFESLHRADTGRIFTNADVIPALTKAEQPVLFEAGTRWSYSNTGYCLLALIVEKVSGSSFADYLASHVFKPAGMRHTYIQTLLADVKDPNRTINYDFQGYAPGLLKPLAAFERNRIPSRVLGSFVGPGNVVSTIGDLQLFDKALYGKVLLKETSKAEAFAPVRLSDGSLAITGWGNTKSYYGLGWMILCDSTKGKIVWHSGGAPGMVSAFLRNITRHQLVITLDNVTHRGLHGIAVNAMALLNGAVPAAEKKSLAHVYANALFEKGTDYAAVLFNTLKGDTAHYFMEEGALNICGLELMWDGHYTPALEALKLNTLLYPNQWNTYDSYAEALWLSGKKEAAIAMYRKSLALNPDNRGGREMLEKILGGGK